MKSLKITLALAVFCLTISGTNNTTEINTQKETIQKIDKSKFQMAGPVKKGMGKPGNA